MKWPGFLLILVCAVSVFAPLMGSDRQVPYTTSIPQWPSSWEGRALTQLPLTETEKAFVADGFPGAIGRFTDGDRTLILRWIERPSRRVHSIADCFESAGWKTRHGAAVRDGEGRVWSRFTAERKGEHLQMRETIMDAAGECFADVSAWYWDAARGNSQGPWLAVTVAEGRGE